MVVEMEDNTLYVKGMPPTEMEDVWDDTVLNNAYDKALKIANEEVAKRIAMETNTVSNKKSEKGKKSPKQDTAASTSAPEKSREWKLGMPCCAIYSADGEEYEAFLLKFVGKEDCVVRFIGYDNCETVAITSLKPSQGDEARLRQMDEAMGVKADDGFESQAHSGSLGLYSEDTSSSEQIVVPTKTNKKKKHYKKQGRASQSHFGDLPNIPMPNINMIKNLGGEDAPLPPPPPLLALSGSEEEQQAISDMLLSWYMTGYYTGLYQGMKRAQKSK